MTANYLPLSVPSNTANFQFPSILDKSFTAIDWQTPWLCHLMQLDYLSKTIRELSGVNEQKPNSIRYDDFELQIDTISKVLNTACKQRSEDLQTSLPTTKPIINSQAYTLNFVSQNALLDGLGYEQFIGTTGNIPTRDNLHDLFNGSIWLTFPKTKAMLNYHHMLEIAKQNDEPNMNNPRGRVRDTITVFDENGAVVVTSDDSIGEALINFDWQGSLVKPRNSWDDPSLCNKKLPNKNAKVAVYIFGHALLEQLIQPRKPLCAHSVVINVSQDFFALSMAERISYLDNKLADYMDNLLYQNNVTPRQLAPLPILGVPHFWPENIDASFYEDDFVFRSGRQRQK